MAAQARKTASMDLARAVFKAKITRDADGLSEDKVNQFFDLLDAAVTRTDAPNIKAIVRFLRAHIKTVELKRATLGAFLKAYCNALDDGPLQGAPGVITPPKPRKCLHLLNLLYQFFWEAHHVYPPELYAKLTTDSDDVPGLGRPVAEIFKVAVESIQPDDSHRPIRMKRLQILIEEFEKHEHFSPMFIAKFRKAISPAYVIAPHLVDPEDLRFDLPQKHGDDKRPWMEAPATSLALTYVTRNRRYNGKAVRAVTYPNRKTKREIEARIEQLKDAIDNRHKARAILKDPAIADKFRDKVGEVQYKVNGEIVGTTYYGFSRKLLERFRKAEKQAMRKRYSREPSPVAPATPPRPVRQSGFPGGFDLQHFGKNHSSTQPSYGNFGRDDRSSSSHAGPTGYGDGSNGGANHSGTGHGVSGGANFGGHSNRYYGNDRGGFSSLGHQPATGGYGNRRGTYDSAGHGFGGARSANMYGINRGGYDSSGRGFAGHPANTNYNNNRGGYDSAGGGFAGNPAANNYVNNRGGYDSTSGGFASNPATNSYANSRGGYGGPGHGPRGGRAMNNSHGYGSGDRGFGGARGSNYSYGRR